MRCSRLTHILLVGLLPTVHGCMEHSQYRGLQDNLDRALYYYEVDRQNTPHAVSDESLNLQDHRSSRVPSPAIVDIDSQIQVLVAKEQLTPGTVPVLAKERSDALLARKKNIQDALRFLGEYVDARKEAVEAFRQRRSDALTAIEEYNEKMSQLLTSIRDVWGKAAPERPALENIFLHRKADPEMKALRGFLQDQINAIEAGDQALAEELHQKRRALQLEAQVMNNEKEALFIHMEGYDTMEQGRLQVRDRWGLNLSAEDRQTLETQAKATKDIAMTLEDLRTKKMSFQEAVAKAGPLLISEELAPDIPEIQRLISEYGPSGIRRNLTEIGASFERLVDAAKASDLPDNLKTQLIGMPEQFKAWLNKSGLDSMGQLSGLITDVNDLCGRWQDLAHQDQMALLLDTTAVLGKLRMMLSDPQFVADFTATVTGFVQAKSDVLADEVAKTLEKLGAGSEFKDLQSRLQKMREDYKKMVGLARSILDKLRPFEEASAATQITSPNALDVPVEDIRDTSMDLRRVRLAPGDEIMFRATLKEDGKEVDSTTASFRVEHLGWYADLSPSVVLVKAADLEGGDNDFQFAPALSWLHHYVPRPEEEGWYMDLARVLEPAVGLHAIFTSFDTPEDDEAIQIGLGATLSFWKSRLQFGTGINLMADSDDNGRYYFFVGTDLIGLLQTVTEGRTR
jgi:hypothetical protein